MLRDLWDSDSLQYMVHFWCQEIGAADFWDPGALKHLLHFSCQEICASNLLRLCCIEASALFMSQDWDSCTLKICCSSYVKIFVLQICWYSSTLKHLLFLCQKICTANLLIHLYIEASALLMSQDVYCKSVDTLVHWSICSSYVTRFVLQICWVSRALKYLLFLCYKICA